jgi:hypothetical protein
MALALAGRPRLRFGAGPPNGPPSVFCSFISAIAYVRLRGLGMATCFFGGVMCLTGELAGLGDVVKLELMNTVVQMESSDRCFRDVDDGLWRRAMW